MNGARVHVVVIAAVMAIVVGAVSLSARGNRVQTTQAKPESIVKPVVSISDTKPAANTAFVAAAEQNASLRNDLTWTFGGKQQHGWYLYDSLIGQTLKTNDQPITNDFAAALALWQRRTGVSSNGVLDEDTLMALVSLWQGNRLKDRTPANPDQLLTAPISDFYDPERLIELRQVERKTYAAYKEMVTAAIADPTLKLDHVGKDRVGGLRAVLQDNLRLSFQGISGGVAP